LFVLLFVVVFVLLLLSNNLFLSSMGAGDFCLENCWEGEVVCSSLF